MIDIRVSENTAQEDMSVYEEIVKGAFYSTIFERLDALEALATELQGKITNSESLNGKDLDACIGKIIIGYGNNCIGRPIDLNGYFINIPHDTMPTTYGKQFYITRSTNYIYMRNLESGVFSEWVAVRYDSGWNDIPLSPGITAYEEASTPQYRKIGSIVYIRGAVIGVTAKNTVIGNLPTGFKPSRSSHYVQNTNVTPDGGASISRLVVSTNGEIKVQGISEGASYGADKWFPINTSFLVD